MTESDSRNVAGVKMKTREWWIMDPNMLVWNEPQVMVENVYHVVEKSLLDAANAKLEAQAAEILKLKQDINLAVSNAGKDLIAERDRLRSRCTELKRENETTSNLNSHLKSKCEIYESLIADIKHSLSNPACLHKVTGSAHDNANMIDSIRELLSDFERQAILDASKIGEKE